MTFWITMMRVFLYSLLGEFNFTLLDLRLVETLAGGVIGGIVAYVFLPVRTKGVMEDLFSKCLEDIREIVASVTRQKPETEKLNNRSRDLDRTLKTLRDTARPIILTRLFRNNAMGGTRFWVRSLWASSYYARQLSRLNIRWENTPEEVQKIVNKTSQNIQNNFSVLIRKLTNDSKPDDQYCPSNKNIDELEALLKNQKDLEQSEELAHFESYVRRLDQILARLAENYR
jgi:uncharacterized membrane protein YccC